MCSSDLAFQVLPGGTVYVRTRDGKLWREPDDGGVRRKVDAEVAQFQAIDGTTVFVLGRDGKLWRETGDMTNRKSLAAGISRFHVVGDTVCALAVQGGMLWRQTGDAPAEQVAGDVVEFQPLDASLVYLRDTAGRLWRTQGNEAKRELVDRSLATPAEPLGFQAVDRASVYVLDRNHVLWRERMPP